MSTAGFASAFGAARNSIWTAIGISAAINLLILAAPFYVVRALELFPLRVGSGGLAGLCLLGVAALGALAMVDEARGRLMGRIATFFEWYLAPQMQGARRADGDLGQLRRVIGGPAAMALLDLPWIPFFLAVIFLVHPILGAATLAGTVVIALLGIAVVLWRDNPHAASAAWFAQLLMQIVAFAVALVLLFADEIGIGAALAAALVIRRTLAPLQANAGGWRELAEAWDTIGRLQTLLRRRAASETATMRPTASIG
jgi:ABC-type protease/lipase transport system fused ATPase/permease subunit